MKRYIILVVAIVFVVASCSKKTTPSLNRKDMLRSGHWSVKSGTITVGLPDGRDTTLNYFNFLPQCRQDDYFVFHDGEDGAVFTNSLKCTPADPDSTTFKWSLTSNDNNLSLYHGFDFIYGVVQTVINPFVFDTLTKDPFLVLDTIHGVLDTEFGYNRVVIVLDTIWNLQFDSTGLQYTNIYNAAISNFSQSEFTLNFSIIASRPDTTGFHTGIFPRPDATPVDTLDFPVLTIPDTFKYKLIYRNN